MKKLLLIAFIIAAALLVVFSGFVMKAAPEQQTVQTDVQITPPAEVVAPTAPVDATIPAETKQGE